MSTTKSSEPHRDQDLREDGDVGKRFDIRVGRRRPRVRRSGGGRLPSRQWDEEGGPGVGWDGCT